MSLHCFAIPALNPGSAQDELNQFLATQRVLAVRREFVADGAASYWALCIEVAHGPGPLPPGLTASGAAAGRKSGFASNAAGASARTVDYKQVLNESDFACFAALRELRKQLAAADGVPIYAVFTNEQLAQVAQQQPRSLADLARIDGIGPARLDKHGEAVLAFLATLAPAIAH